MQPEIWLAPPHLWPRTFCCCCCFPGRKAEAGEDSFCFSHQQLPGDCERWNWRAPGLGWALPPGCQGLPWTPISSPQLLSSLLFYFPRSALNLPEPGSLRAERAPPSHCPSRKRCSRSPSRSDRAGTGPPSSSQASRRTAGFDSGICGRGGERPPLAALFTPSSWA